MYEGIEEGTLMANMLGGKVNKKQFQGTKRERQRESGKENKKYRQSISKRFCII